MTENEAIGGKENVQIVGIENEVIVIVEERGRVVGSMSTFLHLHHDGS
jgi:hypothetical protein